MYRAQHDVRQAREIRGDASGWAQGEAMMATNNIYLIGFRQIGRAASQLVELAFGNAFPRDAAVGAGKPSTRAQGTPVTKTKNTDPYRRFERNSQMLNAKNDDYRLVTADIDLARTDVDQLRANEIARVSTSLGGAAKKLFGNIAVWYKRQRLTQDLEALDDRLLADVGITRGQIPAAVKKALPYAAKAVKESTTEAAAETQTVVSLAAEAPAAPVNDRHPEKAAA